MNDWTIGVIGYALGMATIVLLLAFLRGARGYAIQDAQEAAEEETWK